MAIFYMQPRKLTELELKSYDCTVHVRFQKIAGRKYVRLLKVSTCEGLPAMRGQMLPIRDGCQQVLRGVCQQELSTSVRCLPIWVSSWKGCLPIAGFHIIMGE